MADGIQLNAATTSGAKTATAELSWSGDTAHVQVISAGILTGAEGSWTFTPLAAGAGAVAAGVQRITLASDDPAVAALTAINTSGVKQQGSWTVGASQSGTWTVTGAGGTFPVTDSGGSLTVDAPVATPVFVRLSDGTAAIATLPVSLTSTTITGAVTVAQATAASLNATVVGTGTFAVQAAQSGTWTVTGTGGTFPVTDSGGSLTVDAPVATPVFVRLSDGTAAISTLPVSAASLPLPAGAATSALQTTGNLSLASIEGKITACNTGAVTISGALPAGTNAIGKLAANSGVTIGAVEIAGSQTLSTVTTVGTVTTCSTVTTLTGGGVAHDGVDSGNPIKVGARATTSLSGLALVAAADRTDLMAGVDGVLIVRPHSNLEDIVSGRATNTDGTQTACIASQGAGVKTYLTSVTICNTSASNVTVDIKDGSTVKWTLPVPAGGGAVWNPPNPLPGTAATAWNFQGSAAATTLTCSMLGFKTKI